MAPTVPPRTGRPARRRAGRRTAEAELRDAARGVARHAHPPARRRIGVPPVPERLRAAPLRALPRQQRRRPRRASTAAAAGVTCKSVFLLAPEAPRESGVTCSFAKPGVGGLVARFKLP
jgi:hypothetical protein